MDFLAIDIGKSKKSSFVRMGIFTYYLFTLHFSLNMNEDF